MLRLNTAIAPRPARRAESLGVLGGDNAGFPNGRRPGDDVVDIALRAEMGVLLPPAQAPSGGLPYTDGALVNATIGYTMDGLPTSDVAYPTVPRRVPVPADAGLWFAGTDASIVWFTKGRGHHEWIAEFETGDAPGSLPHVSSRRRCGARHTISGFRPRRSIPKPGALVGLRLLVGQDMIGDPVPREPESIERFVVLRAPARSRCPDATAATRRASSRLHAPGCSSRDIRVIRRAIELPPDKFAQYLGEEGLDEIRTLVSDPGQAERDGSRIVRAMCEGLLSSGASSPRTGTACSVSVWNSWRSGIRISHKRR